MTSCHTVAIIGGGASGLLTAIQLLKLSGREGPRIFLIEKSAAFASGAAYTTDEPSHLLNVRAGNMSAFPDMPNHFMDWLRNGPAGSAAGASSFVSRNTYGCYLQSILRDAVTCAHAAGRFYIVPDEAVSITAQTNGTGGYVVRLELGKDIPADCAVLALGNAPPHPPGIAETSVLKTGHYFGDPWSCDMESLSQDKGPVLLLGTGLTMADAVLALTDRGYKGSIIALSRRGLLPRRHAPAPLKPAPPPALEANIVLALRSVRRAVREHAAGGGDWRAVIDALRPSTVSYWRALPVAEQRRFLRHLRPWWDVHRHRMAPEAAARLEALIEEGRLRLVRGRLKRLELSEEPEHPIRAIWRRARSGTDDAVLVSKIVNCMGPGQDLTGAQSPLVRQMLACGSITPDCHSLGLATDDTGRVQDRAGRANPRIFAIGPITRGTFWEVTAIPDIRVRAVGTALAILQSLEQMGAPVHATGLAAGMNLIPAVEGTQIPHGTVPAKAHTR
jgi:uncharacterized NAD(P)/FAD-binding protein YdhS